MRHETDGRLNNATRYRQSCPDTKKSPRTQALPPRWYRLYITILYSYQLLTNVSSVHYSAKIVELLMLYPEKYIRKKLNGAV